MHTVLSGNYRRQTTPLYSLIIRFSALFFFREIRWTEAVNAMLVAVSVQCPVHVRGGSLRPCYSRRLVRTD